MNIWIDHLLVVAALGGAVAYFAIATWRRRRSGHACACTACARGAPPAPGKLPAHIVRAGRR